MGEPDEVTDTMIDEAILASLDQLAAAGTPTDRPIAWSKVRKTVPGDPWRQALALNRLWQDWRINIMKIDAQTYVAPADADDQRDKELCIAAGLTRDSDTIIIL